MPCWTRNGEADRGRGGKIPFCPWEPENKKSDYKKQLSCCKQSVFAGVWVLRGRSGNLQTHWYHDLFGCSLVHLFIFSFVHLFISSNSNWCTYMTMRFIAWSLLQMMMIITNSLITSIIQVILWDWSSCIHWVSMVMTQGRDLLHTLGVETHGLEPPLTALPWILFNNVMMVMAMFLKFMKICWHWENHVVSYVNALRSTRPNICQGHWMTW